MTTKNRSMPPLEARPLATVKMQNFSSQILICFVMKFEVTTSSKIFLQMLNENWTRVIIRKNTDQEFQQEETKKYSNRNDER